MNSSPVKKKRPGLPKIESLSGANNVKITGPKVSLTKNSEPKSPKKLPHLSPSKMPRRTKKETNNNGQETNDNDPVITDIAKLQEGKRKKKPLKKAESSLGLTERTIKKKVEESFGNNELNSQNKRNSKSENHLNEEMDEISSLSGSLDLSTPEEISVASKSKSKKKTADLPSPTKEKTNLPPPIKTRKLPQSQTKSKPLPSSPSKLPRSPSKQNQTKKLGISDSPMKSRKKFEKTVSEPNFAEKNDTEETIKDKKSSAKSPKKKKSLKKQKSEASILDGEDSVKEESRKNSDTNDGEQSLPKSPGKKVRKSEMVFSDEEQESPFGVSSGRGGSFIRRTTYLDILKIEHERREAIKKIKEEKEKVREKRRDETFSKDKNASKSAGSSKSSKSLVKSNASLKSQEPELPDNIEKLITDTVENTPIISSSVNYNRNRESLVSMIKKKIKEDHFLRSLCMTDEYLMNNIIKVIYLCRVS